MESAQEGHGVGLVGGGSVELGQAHTAQPDGVDENPGMSNFACQHDVSLWFWVAAKRCGERSLTYCEYLLTMQEGR